MDGIDAALIDTDGEDYLSLGESLSAPFTADFRAKLKAFVAGAPERGASPREREINSELTDLHGNAIQSLLEHAGLRPDQVDLIGFHGQTIWHRPHLHDTWQMGDAQRLADETGIRTISDFRSADVRSRGQGAPLVPVFHAALVRRLEKPTAVVNIGGVGNITWIGRDGHLIAFDTGPGNALIDDWVTKHFGLGMDEDGKVAASGKANADIVGRMLSHSFFRKMPPKSLDRHDFSAAEVAHLSPADGVATLTAFTAAAIAKGLGECPEYPARLLITGGGRRNPVLMKMIQTYAGMDAESVDDHGWQGDVLEAQAFAYLAVRSVRGLPLTFPGTTGVAKAMSGGMMTVPREKRAAGTSS